MTGFTRLSVLGSIRKADLVVPDDEPVGGLIPRLMELLDEPPGPIARPLALVRVTGEQLDAARSAGEQEVADGEQLRLVRPDTVPAPPEVADVTDVVGDTYASRRGRWSATARHAAAAVVLGALATVTVLLADPAPATVLLGDVVALAVAVLVGRLGRRWPAVALTAVVLGTLPAAVPQHLDLLWTSRPDRGDPAADAVWIAAGTVGCGWIALGLGVGAGLRIRPAVPAAVIGAALTVLPVILTVGGLRPIQVAAVTAVVATVVCGLLPWWALSASGLTGLDDQVLAGRPSRRSQVLRTVDEAYRMLSWSTAAVALPLGVCSAILVRADALWPVLLGTAVIVLTALRTRAFPLVVQQVPLILAAVGGVLAGLTGQLTTLGTPLTTALAVVFGALVALGAGISPAEHHRARLRRLGGLVEAVLVVALVPVLLGVFGVYADLLQVFR